jgi:hypothetical protein
MSKKTSVAGTPADPTVRYTPLTLNGTKRINWLTILKRLPGPKS